jgi:hypothetical protein
MYTIRKSAQSHPHPAQELKKLDHKKSLPKETTPLSLNTQQQKHTNSSIDHDQAMISSRSIEKTQANSTHDLPELVGLERNAQVEDLRQLD